MTIMHTNKIMRTYWTPEWFSRPDCKQSWYQPRETRDGLLRKLWADEVIHSGAVESVESVDETAVLLRFKSGLEALEVFKTKRDAEQFTAELLAENESLNHEH